MQQWYLTLKFFKNSVKSWIVWLMLSVVPQIARISSGSSKVGPFAAERLEDGETSSCMPSEARRSLAAADRLGSARARRWEIGVRERDEWISALLLIAQRVSTRQNLSILTVEMRCRIDAKWEHLHNPLSALEALYRRHLQVNSWSTNCDKPKWSTSSRIVSMIILEFFIRDDDYSD